MLPSAMSFGGISVLTMKLIRMEGLRMKVVSVNVGLPQEVIWKGMKVSTAIFKHPVDHPVAINTINLVGDQQADLTVHGGRYKAVYGYPVEHYSYWKNQLPDMDFSYGKFGENFTTEGLTEESLHIGDELMVGTATLVVTQPRMPCYKLALRFGMDDMIKRFLVSRKSGFYFAVLEPGFVSAGSEIRILDRDPNRVSVTDILHLYLDRERDIELAQRVQSIDALPESWKIDLLAKAQASTTSESG
jgi:MOSC domain-containing protein YiiM